MMKLLTMAQRYLTQSRFKRLLMPLSFIIFGTILGARFGVVKLWPTFCLYVFLFACQFVEQGLERKYFEHRKIKQAAIYILEGFAVMMLVLVFFSTNLLFASLCALYLLGLHSFFLPKVLKGTLYYIVMQAFFKAFLTNALAFYLQANFISQAFVFQVMPLFFAYVFVVAKSDWLDFTRHGRKARLTLRLQQTSSLVGFVIAYAYPVYHMFVTAPTNVWARYLVGAVWLLTLLLNLAAMMAGSQKLAVKKQQAYLSNVYVFYALALAFLM